MMRLSAGLLATAALVSLAACGHGDSHSDDLARDLELAGSHDGLALAPTGAGTGIVSSIERSPKMVAAPAASRRVTSYRHSAVAKAKAPVPAESAPEEAPRTLADAPAPSEAPLPPVVITARPTPNGGGASREPAGGWSTVGDIIRNAPFPINP